MRFMMMRAENFVVLRRKPVEVSIVSLLQLDTSGQRILTKGCIVVFAFISQANGFV